MREASTSASPVPASARRTLSTGDAALLVGCSPSTIWRAVKAGELPASRLGPHGSHRIARADLERWLRPTTTTPED